MKRRGLAGFSLIELLLAVALLGGVLFALNLFVFSMGDLWGRNTERRLFEQHVRAVTRHVERLLRGANLAASSEVAAIEPAEIRRESGPAAVLLAFELPAGDRTLPWPAGPLPDVVCALDARAGEGLLLLWHSRLETRFTDEPPRTLELSPYGTSVTYEYYEPAAANWRESAQLEKDASGHWRTPGRITLRFAQGSLTAESSLVVPVASTALPAF